MSFEFELFDLISLITILLGLAATYHKIDGRLTIAENRVNKMEKDLMKHEQKLENDIFYIHKKMNVKLDKIDNTLNDVAIKVARLEGEIKK